MRNGAEGGAVFLDRDGTVIHDRHYLADPQGVELLPGAASAIRRLNRAGVPVVLVTNQSGIGRGVISEDRYAAVHDQVEAMLAAEGARLDAVYVCPHAPEVAPPCDCRKPEPGLFLRAAREHGLDLSRSFFVGDRVRDVSPAARFGGVPILVEIGAIPGRDTEDPPSGTHRVHTLEEAAGLVLARLAGD